MNFSSIMDISKRTGKTIKSIRREIALGALKAEKQKNKFIINELDFKTWVETLKSDKPGRKIKKSSKQKEVIRKKVDKVNWLEVKEDMKRVDAWQDRGQQKDFFFIDLFTGAGGLSCGLVMAGMTPVGSVEILKPAVETYKYNFSKVRNFEDNITDRDICDPEVKKTLKDSVKGKHIHLIAGGFPCQGFSLAGNRAVTDPRNSLYLEMLEIVKSLKPDFVLMENVKGLRSMLNGKIEEKIIQDYKKIGYDINVTVLNSADYGVPQYRERVIFVGNRINAINYHPKPFLDETNRVTVGDVLAKYLDMPENIEKNHIFANTSDKILEKIRELPIGKSLYKNYSDGWKKVFWDKPSSTVKENHGGVNIHPILNRLMTPRELATLQSFPDDFIFKGAKKWQLVQIGNAVPPLLGKAIGLAILKSYEEVSAEDK
ncbi:DNA cytosine methyltransferase [Mycoplasmopsis columbinasalis]|uniref:DNA (cytosine-5-)-methyltransferase n=1 Tax=Mycoplasmopsis columbinasalis TaxID=114880 RepID=A0A449B9V7_9BACT|nr:DNA cytosine methyltransferase [Mycoplasmopsis columbinasalis]VEU77961.1 cytosine-specific methyltransferase [Mycoplasmopsis columbinasalis]